MEGDIEKAEKKISTLIDVREIFHKNLKIIHVTPWTAMASITAQIPLTQH